MREKIRGWFVILEKKPFVNYTLPEDKVEDKREVVPLSINKEERVLLELDKKLLQQAKDGTAIKQLIELGRIVLHSGFSGKILEVVLNNRKKNARVGVIEFEQM